MCIRDSVKIALKRFLKISILKKTRTPLHDHVRKNLGWSDTQVVVRFLILQTVLAAVSYTHLDVYKRQVHNSYKELRGQRWRNRLRLLQSR